MFGSRGRTNRRGAGSGAPFFEPLEARLLLDGNVVVLPIGGALYVFGDADANDILIEDGAPGLSITGRNGTHSLAGKRRATTRSCASWRRG